MNVNCREYQHQITLLLYDELLDGARRELEGHLQQCADCKRTFDAERSVHSLLAEDVASWDVPSDLLVESRRALSNKMDNM